MFSFIYNLDYIHISSQMLNATRISLCRIFLFVCDFINVDVFMKSDTFVFV